MEATKKVFRGTVRIGVTPEGKPVTKTVSAASRRELEEVKAAVRDHYLHGREVPKDYAFYEYAETWYRTKKEPFISQSSRTSYRSLFMKHLLPEFGLQQMRAIKAQDIQEFINCYAGKSRTLIATLIGTLRAIFASACAEGVVDRDPTLGLVRPKASQKTERRALTPEETQRILNVIENHEDGLFLAVLYYLGLRRGEALGLMWKDFDLDEGQVHIQRDIDFAGGKTAVGDLKTRAAERYVPIPEELKALLLAKQGAPDEYLFHTAAGKPVCQTSFKRTWAGLMMAAGLVEWKPGARKTDELYTQVSPLLTPHFFRHNFVTMLYESGVDPLIAMKIVGHSNYQTTANVYTHIKDEMLKKATINMSEVFKNRAAGEA